MVSSYMYDVHSQVRSAFFFSYVVFVERYAKLEVSLQYPRSGTKESWVISILFFTFCNAKSTKIKIKTFSF